MQPLAVWMGACQLSLDLIVGDDPSRGGVNQKHFAGFESALCDDLRGWDVKHTAFAGEDDTVVDGAPPAPRP